MNVLGIETSCDETGVGVYNDVDGLVAHEVYTQAGIHERYGGVVPELASRDHVRKTAPLIKQTLDNAGLAFRDLDGIAFTAGPGLVGALLVGATIARSLAFSLGIRAIEINHLEGHLLTPMLAPDPPQMPFLALLVSGGHSMFIDVQGIGHYDVIGESLDDAAGEAFDKTAKLLGLGYPGGPEIERLAAQGDPGRFRFPRPMTNRPGLDLSFSGLKTYTMNTVRAHENDPRAKADIARAFVEAVVDTFVIKCRRAIRATGHTSLVVCGGVSANRQLREALSGLSRDEGVRIDFPPLDLCTDNGAMIAYAGYRRLCTGASTPLKYQLHPRWPLTEISAVERPHTPARRTRV